MSIDEQGAIDQIEGPEGRAIRRGRGDTSVYAAAQQALGAQSLGAQQFAVSVRYGIATMRQESPPPTLLPKPKTASTGRALYAQILPGEPWQRLPPKVRAMYEAAVS